MKCPKCFTEISDVTTNCPACNTPLSFGRLAALSTENSFAIERKVSREVVEGQNQYLLQRMEDADKHIDAILAGQLNFLDVTQLVEIEASVSQSLSLDPPTDALVAILDTGIEKLSLEGLSLHDLLTSGNAKLSGILKTGLLFLKNKKYREALEWWTLQSKQPDILANPKLELLFMIMEMFTFRLSGDSLAAENVTKKIRQHPEFIRSS